MKLRQFLFTVFPSISRSKSERSEARCDQQNGRLSKSDRLKRTFSCIAEYTTNPVLLQAQILGDEKSPNGDTSDNSETTPTLIQTFQYEDEVFDSAERTPRITTSFSFCHDEMVDCKKAFDSVERNFLEIRRFDENLNSLKDDELNQPLDSLDPFEKDSDGVLLDFDGDEELSSPKKPRSKIRTNPWLASSSSAQQQIGQLRKEVSSSAETQSSLPTPDSDVFRNVPDSESLRTSPQISGHLLLTTNDLFLRKPGMLDEGYATSIIQSPSLTDVDCGSTGGGNDSALASSVSSESDLEWLDRSLSVTSTPGEEFGGRLRRPEMTTDRGLDADLLEGDVAETGRSSELKNSEDGRVSDGRISDYSSLEALSLQKLVGDGVEDSEKDVERIFRSVSGSQTEPSPATPDVSSEAATENRSQSLKEERLVREFLSVDGSIKNPSLVGTQVETDPDGNPGSTVSGADPTSTRPLIEVSKSLQEKVELLHEQKHYVDAIFHRAREVDRRKAQFRSQFMANRKRMMLERLRELQQMLASQSTRLQLVYDAILLKRWPKVFSKINGP